jgi:hypothetical protein
MRQADSATLIAIMFLLPFGLLVILNIVGQLYLADIIAPLILAILVGRPGARNNLAALRTYLILMGLWLFGSIVTDIYRQIPFEDYARGWSIIIFFAIHTMVLWLLCQGRINILAAYTFGLGAMSSLRAFVFPSGLDMGEPWKFGGGFGLIMMVASLGAVPQCRRWAGEHFATVLVGLLAVASLLMNSRSLFAIAVLSTLYSVLAAWCIRSSFRVTPVKFALLMLVGVFLSQGMTEGYGAVAEAGFLGDKARSKYERQTAGDISMFAGARPESAVAFQAIVDSPLIGHGSWAKDTYYLQIYYEHVLKLGLPTFRSFGEYEQYAMGRVIPTHSHVLGSWVYSGIAGALVWIWAMGLAVVALYRMLNTRGLPVALISFSAFSVLWDVPFSPFGAEQRVMKAAQICVLLIAVLSPATIQHVRTSRPIMRLRNRIPRRPNYAAKTSNP